MHLHYLIKKEHINQLLIKFEKLNWLDIFQKNYDNYINIEILNSKNFFY